MIYVEMNVVSIFREQKAKGHVARQWPKPSSNQLSSCKLKFLDNLQSYSWSCTKAKKIYLFLSTYFFYHVNHQKKSISSFIITSLKRIFSLHAYHREKVKESK